MKFIGYELFPPNKRNIIIARYSCSQEFLKKIKEIIQIIENESGVRISDMNNFEPHITLGKITNTEMIEEVIATLKPLNDFKTNGLYLCGHINAPNKMKCKDIVQKWNIQL